MCAISGFISNKKIILKHYYDAHQTLKHRGPDDEGYYVIDGNNIMHAFGYKTTNSNKNGKFIKDIEKANICMGHFRLSIIDLSENAHQPFRSDCDKFAVIFNGEIYNYLEIRDELIKHGYRFKTNSDTEIVLYAYIHWKERCFNMFNGMWAMAIIDYKERTLILSRDRFGIKPLYYTIQKEIIYFGSELKFFKKLNIDINLNEKAALKYVDGNIIDDNEETIYKEIFSIPPAKYFKIGFNSKVLSKNYYWKLESKLNIKSCDSENQKKLKELFISSLNFRMRSDVPIGTLLSGGLDSNTIVSLLCSLTHFKIKELHSFSAVFKDQKFSEYNYIKSTQKKYPQILPHYIFPSPLELADDFDNLFHIIETPFRSLSVYSQYCIYKYIKKETRIKVLLNGQGADELFAGYSDHYNYYYLELIRKFKIIQLIIEILYLNKYRKNNVKKHLFQTLYLVVRLLKSKFHFGSLVKGNNNGSVFKAGFQKNYAQPIELKEKLMNNLMVSALPEYLKYEDRNSMAFSLETRLPFLDYRLVEYLFSLPSKAKIHNGENKYLLRRTFSEYITKKIINRKDKMGFISPQEIWQKTFLKNKMKRVLLSPDQSGLFDQKQINKLTIRYYDTEYDADGWLLWRIFCFKYWYSLMF